MERIRRALARMAARADDLLFPEDVLCLCCDHALGPEDAHGICGGCRRELARLAAQQEMREAREEEPLPEGIDALHAAFVYEGPARRLCTG